jgi:transporter family-2 protein
MMKAMSRSQTEPRPPARRPEVHHYLINCMLAAVAGAALAVQSRINGDFGHHIDDGIVVALVSFGSSLVVCALLLALLAARGKAGALFHRIRTSGLPPWYYLGGIAGAYTIVSQGTAVAALGVAVFTIAAVAGQSMSGLFVDRLGVGPAGRQPLTAFRVAGTALALVAVVVSVSGQVHSPKSIGLIVLPALAGIGTPWHQAFNGQVRVCTDSTLAATSVNFLVGTLILLPVVGVDLAVRGLPHWTSSPPWPAYIGGPLGVAFIAINVTVVRYIGVLLLALATIAGQLVMAIILDVIAPEEGSHPGPGTYIGTALTIVAVAVAASHRRHH